MRKFLKFVHDDVVYCKYYEVVYILFHTGMRISEFCGLTLKDIDTVEDIFCCAYAPYFWQAIQIRYPEYVVYNQKLHAMLGGID